MPASANFSRRSLLKGLLTVPFLAGCSSWRTPSPPDLVDPSKGPGAGWSIVVFPDTQNYAKYAKNQANFELMTEWVLRHRRAWNVRLVMHEGDFVEQNGIAVGGGAWFWRSELGFPMEVG